MFFARIALLAVGQQIYRRWGWRGLIVTAATLFTTLTLLDLVLYA